MLSTTWPLQYDSNFEQESSHWTSAIIDSGRKDIINYWNNLNLFEKYRAMRSILGVIEYYGPYLIELASADAVHYDDIADHLNGVIERDDDDIAYFKFSGLFSIIENVVKFAAPIAGAVIGGVLIPGIGAAAGAAAGAALSGAIQLAQTQAANAKAAAQAQATQNEQFASEQALQLKLANVQAAAQTASGLSGSPTAEPLNQQPVAGTQLNSPIDVAPATPAGVSPETGAIIFGTNDMFNDALFFDGGASAAAIKAENAYLKGLGSSLAASQTAANNLVTAADPLALYNFGSDPNNPEGTGSSGGAVVLGGHLQTAAPLESADEFTKGSGSERVTTPKTKPAVNLNAPANTLGGTKTHTPTSTKVGQSVIDPSIAAQTAAPNAASFIGFNSAGQPIYAIPQNYDPNDPEGATSALFRSRIISSEPNVIDYGLPDGQSIAYDRRFDFDPVPGTVRAYPVALPVNPEQPPPDLPLPIKQYFSQLAKMASEGYGLRNSSPTEQENYYKSRYNYLAEVPQVSSLNVTPLGGTSLNARVTAYSPNEPKTDPFTAGVQSSANPHGIPLGARGPLVAGLSVATDPKVIPYGSLINIPGVGWRISNDTGGALPPRTASRGTSPIVDVYFPSYTEQQAYVKAAPNYKNITYYPPGTWETNSSLLSQLNSSGSQSFVAQDRKFCSLGCQCADCLNDYTAIYGDNEFASVNAAQPGVFFSSAWVKASLDDLSPDTFGLTYMKERPFVIKINRNVTKDRAIISYIHEVMHTADELFKLHLPHESVHALAVYLSTEMFPGLIALTNKYN